MTALPFAAFLLLAVAWTVADHRGVPPLHRAARGARGLGSPARRLPRRVA